jgi:hypothetical protein
MIEYRILKALVLGYIDPKHDEQRDVLIRPGDAPSGSMAALSSSDGATGGHSWISPKHAHR